jgi:hypothetical protein
MVILEAFTIFFARPSRFPRLRARATAPLIAEHGGAANVNLCDVHRWQGVKKTVWHAFYRYVGEGGILTQPLLPSYHLSATCTTAA